MCKIATILFVIAGIAMSIAAAVIFSQVAINETIDMQSYSSTIATVYGFGGVKQICDQCYGCSGGISFGPVMSSSPCICNSYPWTSGIWIKYVQSCKAYRVCDNITCGFLLILYNKCGNSEAEAATIAAENYNIGDQIYGYYLNANRTTDTGACQQFTTKFKILWVWWVVASFFIVLSITSIFIVVIKRNKIV